MEREIAETKGKSVTLDGSTDSRYIASNMRVGDKLHITEILLTQKIITIVIIVNIFIY